MTHADVRGRQPRDDGGRRARHQGSHWQPRDRWGPPAARETVRAGKAAFDELRLLTNLTADDRPLVGLLLVGQPELRERLRRAGGEAFAQRVGVAYHLGALDRDETEAYLRHRLEVAGRRAPLFTRDAVEAIHARSGGLPRRVNQVAQNAMLEAFGRDAEAIDAAVVEAAAADLDRHLGPGRGPG